MSALTIRGSLTSWCQPAALNSPAESLLSQLTTTLPSCSVNWDAYNGDFFMRFLSHFVALELAMKISIIYCKLVAISVQFGRNSDALFPGIFAAILPKSLPSCMKFSSKKFETSAIVAINLAQIAEIASPSAQTKVAWDATRRVFKWLTPEWWLAFRVMPFFEKPQWWKTSSFSLKYHHLIKGTCLGNCKENDHLRCLVYHIERNRTKFPSN